MPFNCFKMCLYGVYAVLLVAMTADMTAGKTELEIKRSFLNLKLFFRTYIRRMKGLLLC